MVHGSHFIGAAEPMGSQNDWSSMTRNPLRTRSIASLLTTAVVLGTLGVLTSPSAAAGAAPTVSQTQVDESVDFATTQFLDPWDFSNNQDVPNHVNLNLFKMTNTSRSGGVLKGNSEAFGFVRLLQSWDNSGIPWGRDGALNEIDTATYDRISFRMKTDLSQSRTGGRVVWYDCGQLRGECQGGTKFVSEPGWHTYDVELVNDPEYPVAWQGMVRGLSLIPSRMATNFELDWIRLYDSSTGQSVSVSPSSAGEVYWDRDGNQANNTASNPNWGRVDTSTTGESVTFNADAYPPGVYRFYSVDGSGASAYSSTLKIDARPRVQVINPDLAGGTSYAKKVRKDPWDFKQASDMWLTPNASVQISGGKAVGVNTQPDPTDSGVYLAVKNGKPINTSQFHRLTIKVFYAGDFSLSAAPGGGMNGRIAWHRADSDVYITSDDIVVHPGWNTITLDLSDFSPSELIEPYSSGMKWKGLKIDQFRFDPHEDAGARQFKIDHIHLSRDDRATRKKFSVKFRDKAYEPGSTVKVYVDTDNSGFDGTLMASQALTPGQNKVVIHRADTGRGKRWVYVEVTDPSGTMSRSYSTGPVKM